MARLYVRHTVSDYAAWRKGYDAFDAKRRSLGVTGDAVYRSVENPNDVTIWHDFANVDQAKALVTSDALKDAMKNAGVVGAPTAWITNEA